MPRYTVLPRADAQAVILGIEEIDEKKELLDRQRCAQMDELVAALAFSEGDAEHTLVALGKIKSDKSPDLLGVDERVEACRKFLSLFPDTDIYKKELLIRIPKKSGNYTVGMLRNSYSDQALSEFSLTIPTEARSLESFEDICESIVSGECDFGILPTESSDNGKLIRFYSLIDKYDLKINAVVDTENEDGTETTRYALISRTIYYPDSVLKDPDHFEFSINLSDPRLLGEIIYAASKLGMKLLRIDSLPVPYKDREFLFCPVFDVKEAYMDAFLLYMYLDFPQYTPIGIFPRL